MRIGLFMPCCAAVSHKDAVSPLPAQRQMLGPHRDCGCN